METHPYRSIILEHVLEHGERKKVLVPMEAGVLVELLEKGTLRKAQLDRIAYDFAKRERTHNASDLQRRTARDYVYAVSSEALLGAKIEACDYQEELDRLEHAMQRIPKRQRTEEEPPSPR